MPIQLSFSTLSINEGKEGLSRSYTYTPESIEDAERKGILLAAISDASNAPLSESIFEKLRESYYSSVDISPISLKNAVSSIDSLIGSTEVVVSVYCSSKLYCLAVNGGKVILFRGGSYATLIDGKPGQVHSMSGFLKTGDSVVIASSLFVEYVSEEMLKNSLPSKDVFELPVFYKPLLDIHAAGQSYSAIFAKATDTRIEINHIKNSKNLNKNDEELIEEDIVSTNEDTSSDHLERNRMFLRNDKDQNKFSRTTFVGIIGVLLLIGFTILGYRARDQILKEETFQSTISALEMKLDESKKLANINPEASRILFDEAKAGILGVTSDNESQSETLSQVQSRIDNFQKEVYGENFSTFDLIVDLQLLSEGFSVSSTKSDSNSLYIFDAENKKLARVSFLNGRAEIVAGPTQLDEVNDISSYVDTVYALSSEEIFDIDTGDSIIRDQYQDALFYVYAGNVYVVDKKSSEIYRYNRTFSGYSGKSRWLNEGITAKLQDAKQMVIDGSIWVLTNNQIFRFTNGTYWAFSPKSILPPLSGVTSLFTNENEENIYLLDSVSSRVVAVTKQGDFVKQYINDEIKNAVSISVSSKNSKLYIITQNKVYSTDL